jgi:8-oxo-dGTP pyrophosphatase MutT (NUDIX family)
MEQKIIDVVGTMFFKDGKILIDKPRKRSTFQMVGGSVENGELPSQAAVRECHEELGDKAIFDTNKLEFVMDFIETATSNPSLKIHMHIFKYNGLLEGELTESDEIESFMWFGSEDDTNILSNTLKNEVIPYALEQGLIYKSRKLG